MVKKAIVTAMAVISLFTLMGCNNRAEVDTLSPAQAAELKPMPQSWRGVLPCADCEGIETSLFLEKDGTWVMNERYLGAREEPSSFASYGTWARTADKLVLTDSKGEKSYYRAKGDALEMLDREGNPIESQFNYTLEPAQSSLPMTPMTLRGMYFYMADAATFTEGDAENEWVLTVVGTAAPVGDYSAKISFTDAYGASASETVEYSILENRAPVATGAAEDVLLTRVGEAVEIDLAGLISDPDGETLKWSIANSSPGTVHATVTGNMAYVTALAFGNAEITVTATDVMGEQCSLSFSVVVKNPESPLEVFPNPVSDYLNVRTLDEAETTIRISTSTGALVYDETSQVSVFDPAVIDMRGYAPGKYTVNVSFGGGEYTRTVVKL